ncbi:hypothetical protein [uncultured Paraglaciecola sp.]|uniref:hypothetical protein n=1 Tax=uncultured Paraglaciecola sp. TaxID=1765024 RepID=UPI002607C8CD|nr:hypothetical protein [uncultured Paraglaciecola sp.]
MGWNNLANWNSIASVTQAIISAVSSSRGADIATANETLTLTLNDTTGVTSVSSNAVACTSVTIVNGTSLTCVCPLEFLAEFGTSGDIVVNNGVDSAGYSVTLEPPSGMTEYNFGVPYASLNVKSPFANDARFNIIAVPDSCILSLTSPSGYHPRMASDGLITLYTDGTFSTSVNPTVTETVNYFLYDASDNTVSLTIEQLDFDSVVDALSPTSVESASESSSPAINQTTILTAIAAQSAVDITVPSLVQAHVNQAVSAESAVQASVPSFNQNHSLSGDNATSASESLAVSIGQRHVMQSTGAESAAEGSTPALVSIAGDSLIGSDIQSGAEVGAPVITQHHVLAANAIESGAQASTINLNQSHILLGVQTESASATTIPAFWQNHVISADDIQSLSTVSSPSVIEPGEAVQIIGGDIAITRLIASTQTINRTITQTARLS